MKIDLDFEKIRQDLRDRFTTWETILGGAFIITAIFIYSYPQYLVNFAVPGVLLFVGFKWLFENKYRKQHKVNEKTKAYRDQ